MYNKVVLLHTLSSIYLKKEIDCKTQYLDFLINEGYVFINEFDNLALTPKGYNSLKTDPFDMGEKQLSYLVKKALVKMAKGNFLGTLFARSTTGEKYLAHFEDDTVKDLLNALGVEVELSAPADEVILETPAEEVVIEEKVATKKGRKKA